jgi:hypothetical protein
VLAVLLLVVQPLSQTPKPVDVDELLNKVHAAYQKIHSADITVRVQFGATEKNYVLTCRTRWVSPYLIHQDISDAKPSLPSLPIEHGFTYICDGKKLQTIGRSKEKDGIKNFSLSSIQDDGAPVYKETTTLWDWQRQWRGEKGGKQAGFQYHTAMPTWNGKKWIGIAEMDPGGEYFQYYVDPKTYLIKRVVYYVAGEKDWVPAGNYVVTAFQANPKIDPSIFRIKN